MNLHDLKINFVDALEEWALSVVDSFATGSPRMTMAGVYIKNGIRNYRKKKEEEINEMVDDLALFVADENGNINMDKVLADVMQFVNDSEEIPVSLGFMQATIGKGAVKLHLPDNVFLRMIFGENNAIVIKQADIQALKALIEE